MKLFTGLKISAIALMALTLSPSFSSAQQKLKPGVNYADKVNTLIGTAGKGKSPQEMYLEAGFTFPLLPIHLAWCSLPLHFLHLTRASWLTS